MTLIVSASFDGSHEDWYDALPNPKVRVDTSQHGGYVSGALIDTYRFGPKADSYLVVQDTMEPLFDRVVDPFLDAAEAQKTPAVAWARFPMFFDNGAQEHWVKQQYQQMLNPEHGIFGPVFYVERKVLEKLDKLGRLPKKPTNKNEANGTERAWSFALALLGIKPGYLHEWSEEFLTSGDALPFRKVYAGRQ